MNILIIEDNPEVQESLKLLCKEVTDACITIASDGAEGLIKLNSEIIFDLIITDLNMPYFGGKDIVRNLKSEPNNPNYSTPVIILSGELKLSNDLVSPEIENVFFLDKFSHLGKKLTRYIKLLTIKN